MTLPPAPSLPESSTTDPVRVLVADDHALFRRGIVLVLELEEGIEVAGEAADGAAAVDLAMATAPDVVLLDVRMPGMDGIDTCAKIHSLIPSARIVMLSGSDDETDLLAALKAGATGYLLKTVGVEDIAAAVREVHAGQSPLSPALASKVLVEFGRLAREIPATSTRARELSPRELEVLQATATGLSTREIATQLFISENTVKNHVRNILDKLQLHSRVEAVMYAAKRNLIDLS